MRRKRGWDAYPGLRLEDHERVRRDDGFRIPAPALPFAPPAPRLGSSRRPRSRPLLFPIAFLCEPRLISLEALGDFRQATPCYDVADMRSLIARIHIVLT